MKRWSSVIVVSAMLGSFALALPQAKSQGQGQKGNSHHADDHGMFGSVEIKVIREWFGNPTNLKSLPPGLARKEKLPPGLARQLQRNGTLPPGLQKRVQPLPRDLEVRLPRLPDGRKRVIVMGAVIMIDEKLGRILDVLSDVL